MKNNSKNSLLFGSSFFISPRAAIFGLAFAAISTASFAAGTPEQRQACTSDVFRLCSSDIPNVDRIVACLKRQRSNLSPACQAVFGTETACRDPLGYGFERERLLFVLAGTHQP